MKLIFQLIVGINCNPLIGLVYKEANPQNPGSVMSTVVGAIVTET